MYNIMYAVFLFWSLQYLTKEIVSWLGLCESSVFYNSSTLSSF